MGAFGAQQGESVPVTAFQKCGAWLSAEQSKMFDRLLRADWKAERGLLIHDKSCPETGSY